MYFISVPFPLMNCFEIIIRIHLPTLLYLLFTSLSCLKRCDNIRQSESVVNATAACILRYYKLIMIITITITVANTQKKSLYLRSENIFAMRGGRIIHIWRSKPTLEVNFPSTLFTATRRRINLHTNTT